MEKKHIKMWLVKREVMAKSLAEAIRKPGRVYSVEEAGKEYQPEEIKKIGFTDDLKKSQKT